MSTVGKSGTGGWRRRLRTLTGPRDRDQLLDSLRAAQEHGLLDADAYTMLEGVLQVADLQARDIMVPRDQMVCVRHDDPPARVLSAVIDSGHSRFPVLQDDGEQIGGILLAKDMLRLFALAPGQPFDIAPCIRAAVFVPETKRVNMLLKEFRLNRFHMAIVVDEYGGIAGLVTIEDIIEEIIGEIDDEYDVADEANIRSEGERQFFVRGATPIDEFNGFFNTTLPEDEFDTVAGLVSHQFGRMPRRGESVTLEGIELRVVRADRRRIETLRVTPPEPVVDDADATSLGADSG